VCSSDLVDGHDQAEPLPHFNWDRVPEGKCLHWSPAQVTGALTYPGQVEFIRTLAHPRPGLWEVTDQFIGLSEHQLEWHFHFAPGLSLHFENESVLTVCQQGQPFVQVQIPENGLAYRVADDWNAYQYGKKQSNRQLIAHWQGTLSAAPVHFGWRFQMIEAHSMPGENPASAG
jgi:hypothetical protein